MFLCKVKAVELMDPEEVIFWKYRPAQAWLGAARSTQEPHIKDQWLTLGQVQVPRSKNT